MMRALSIPFTLALVVLIISLTDAQDEPAGAANPADATPQTAVRDARKVVESYVAAALEGRVSDAVALAEPGKSTASTKRIRELPEMLGVRFLRIRTVIAAEKAGMAIAVSAPVKLTKPNPDGQATGCLAFMLIQVDGTWLVKDIDFEAEAAAVKVIEAFIQEHQDVKEIFDRTSVEQMPKIFHLIHADAKSLAELLQPLFESDIITADQRTNSLIANCDPTRVNDLDAVIRILDGRRAVGATRLPKTSGLTQVFPLKHAKASTLAQTLSSLFQARALFDQPPLFVADKATNSLLVAHAADRLEAITNVVKKLDHATGSETAQSFINQWARRRKPDQSDPLSLFNPRDPHEQLDAKILELAAQYQAARTEGFERLGERVKQELRETVTRAFAARQQRQREELAKLQQRFERIHQLIETRERIKGKIIEHRVEELLNPALRWNASTQGDVYRPSL
ncbi:MAG: hypothetical protein IH991_24045, partial [Planctomycetes bacterium]|nr:hypothetical protein [Planctomycetota bacterium]